MSASNGLQKSAASIGPKRYYDQLVKYTSPEAE